MKIGWIRFNIYLAFALLVVIAGGCKSGPEAERKKVLATIRLHLEARKDASDRTQAVPIYRANPVMVNVEKQAFVSEHYVKSCKVVEDEVGGFSLSIQFDQRGSWLLEQASGANRSKRIAIFSQFADKLGVEPNQARWLAAPVIQKHIPDGVLVFTPDATREEAEFIAMGLNNAAKKLQSKL